MRPGHGIARAGCDAMGFTMTEGRLDLSRTAIYARYSSPQQKPTSIDDQLRDCLRYVMNRSGQVHAQYSDARRSGGASIYFRTGIQSLINDCSVGHYSAVCTESLDRITRNQRDIADFYQQLTYFGVMLVTLEEGIITPLHVGLKGTMNAMFLQSLSEKTRRGQRGTIRRGRMVARAPFGYRNANRIEGARVERGLREIDPDQAAIVRRIFKLYANGTSAKAIAQLLNAEGIPPPRGGAKWRHTVLVGMNSRSTILSNRIYIGEMIYGQTQSVRNPATGRAVYRQRPEEDWEIQHIPELRIIDDETWNIVQDRIIATSRPRTPPPGLPSLPKGAKPLTPILRCMHCNGPINSLSRERWACTASRARKECRARTFVLRDLEALAARHLAQWIGRRRNWDKVVGQALAELGRRRGDLQERIDLNRQETRRLVEVIKSVEEPPPTIVQEIAALDREHATLLGKLSEATATRLPPLQSDDLKPALLAKATELRDATESPHPYTRLRAAFQLSQLLDAVELSAGDEPGKPKLRIRPNVLALLDWTTASLQPPSGPQPDPAPMTRAHASARATP